MIVSSNGRIVSGNRLIINEAINEFLGTVNNQWTNAANWSLGVIPAFNHIAVIKANCLINFSSLITVRKLIVDKNITLGQSFTVSTSLAATQGIEIKGLWVIDNNIGLAVTGHFYAEPNSLKISAPTSNANTFLTNIQHDVNLNQLLAQDFYSKTVNRLRLFKTVSNDFKYRLNADYLVDSGTAPILQIYSETVDAVVDLNGYNLYVNNLHTGSFFTHKSIVNSGLTTSNLTVRAFATGRISYDENNINLIFNHTSGCTIYGSDYGSTAGDVIRFNKVDINVNLNYNIGTTNPLYARALTINPYDRITIANGVVVSMDISNIASNYLEFQNTVQFGTDVTINVKGVNTFGIGNVVFTGATPTLISDPTGTFRYLNTTTRDIIPANYGRLELISTGQKKLIGNTTCDHLYFAGTATLDLNGYTLSGYTKYTDNGTVVRTLPSGTFDTVTIGISSQGMKTLSGDIICNTFDFFTSSLAYINYNGFSIIATTFNDTFNANNLASHVGGDRNNVRWTSEGTVNLITPMTIYGDLEVPAVTSAVNLTGSILTMASSSKGLYNRQGNQNLTLGIGTFSNLNLTPLGGTAIVNRTLVQNIVVTGTFIKGSTVTIIKNGFTVKDSLGNDLA